MVILNKSDYINKCQDHLNDTDTYTLKNSDNSICLRKQINSFLKKLFDSKLLTRTQYTKLFANSATLPLFYGLIKIHKPDNPIRPIVSFIGSPSYYIAQFLSKLLTPFVKKSPHRLKNSYETKEKLKNIIVPDNHLLVSFDVKALFTSIPLDFAKECFKKFLVKNSLIFDQTRLNLNELLKLVDFCLDASFFRFNGKIFKQIKGTPMGSPVSAVIAEIVMQELENLIITSN